MKSLLAIALLFSFATTQAQRETDTIVPGKSVQELEMQSKISSKQQIIDKKKLELGELKAKLEVKNDATDDAAQKSSESNDKNVDAAVDLQKNNTHKNTRQSRKAAKKAQRDAGDLRDSNDDMAKIKKSIRKMEKEIAKDEKDLAEMKSKSLSYFSAKPE